MIADDKCKRFYSGFGTLTKSGGVGGLGPRGPTKMFRALSEEGYNKLRWMMQLVKSKTSVCSIEIVYEVGGLCSV